MFYVSFVYPVFISWPSRASIVISLVYAHFIDQDLIVRFAEHAVPGKAFLKAERQAVVVRLEVKAAGNVAATQLRELRSKVKEKDLGGQLFVPGNV